MKDPHFVAWQPMFHWTDSKIRVHAFYSVLALTVTSLLRREVLRRAANCEVELEGTSIEGILDTLAEVNEVIYIYPPGSGIKPQHTISEMSPAQKQLLDLLDLQALAPRSVLQEDG